MYKWVHVKFNNLYNFSNVDCWQARRHTSTIAVPDDLRHCLFLLMFLLFVLKNIFPFLN